MFDRWVHEAWKNEGVVLVLVLESGMSYFTKCSNAKPISKQELLLTLKPLQARKQFTHTPNLSPPGLRALLSPGQVFLFAVMDAISSTFSTRAPSIP